MAPWLRRVGFALGGQPGARLARAQGIATGRTTLLRAIRSADARALPTPRVHGVDDWSWRRGRTYGTLLTDLERHRPVLAAKMDTSSDAPGPTVGYGGRR